MLKIFGNKILHIFGKTMEILQKIYNKAHGILCGKLQKHFYYYFFYMNKLQIEIAYFYKV